jgi:hypothetical protein
MYTSPRLVLYGTKFLNSELAADFVDFLGMMASQSMSVYAVFGGIQHLLVNQGRQNYQISTARANKSCRHFDLHPRLSSG